MIHLALRTEYSFKSVFAHIDRIVDQAKDRGDSALGIADINSTYGHIRFHELCKKAGIKPILGARFKVVNRKISGGSKNKSYDAAFDIVAIAKNAVGLIEINKMVNRAFDNFYYEPKLYHSDLEEVNSDVIIITEYVPPEYRFVAMRIDYYSIGNRGKYGLYSTDSDRVALLNNHFINKEDKAVYQSFAYPRFDNQAYPMHVLSENEMIEIGITTDEMDKSFEISELVEEFDLPKAGMVKYEGDETIIGLCIKGAEHHGIDINQGEYAERLRRELSLIESKEYTGYFLILADLIRWAKQRLFVGPARGSSGGSLVCYLMGITEIDPIKYGLLFERFIDENRHDLPDIDTDFADSKRQLVLKYLTKKYGQENVRHIATITKMKAKSSIDEFAKSMQIPISEIQDVKDAIIERSGGDARAQMCVADTLSDTNVGVMFMQKHPEMSIVSEIEGHARNPGRHAAGLIISNEPLWKYGGIDSRENVIQMNGKEAENMGLLKVDVLGLRTLSILEESARFIGMEPYDIYKLPLDDENTYKVFAADRYLGIFQFTGKALQVVSKSMGVKCFEDIVAITALARPGALNSGGTEKFIKRHIGEMETEYYGELHENITKSTHGVVVYQEQMMNMARIIGKLSWKDVQMLRKAASKTYGDEFFGKYEDKFVTGAKENDYTQKEAKALWKQVSSAGSWIFNRCLSGDTKIILTHRGRFPEREVTIRDLYEMYVLNPKAYVKTRMNKGIGPQLISLFPDGRCRKQNAVTITYSGRKKLWLYEFSNGSSVKCTKNHKFIINDKWAEIGSAIIGDRVKIGEEVSLPDTTCEDCSSKHDRLECHHDDFNHGIDRPSDIILCPGCHKKRHYEHGRNKVWQKGYVTSDVNIINIVEIWEEDTYDIEMPEHHNFLIEGGIITHNSHAVAYAMLSYYTAYFKANHPLEFAAANMIHSKKETQVGVLRDFVVHDGIEYIPVDPDESDVNWTIKDGKLLGGLMNIDGIAEVKAKQIIARRTSGAKNPPSIIKKLMNPTTPFDILFPTRHNFGNLYDHPGRFGLSEAPKEIKDVIKIGEYVIIGQVKKIDLRDRNDYQSVFKRGYEVDENRYYLNLYVEDDTDNIRIAISPFDFDRLNGKHLAETLIVDETYVMVKGKIKDNWRTLAISSIMNLSEWKEKNK